MDGMSFAIGFLAGLVLMTIVLLVLVKMIKIRFVADRNQASAQLQERLRLQDQQLIQSSQEREHWTKEREGLQRQIQDLTGTLHVVKTRWEEEQKHSQEKLKLLEEAKAQLGQQFKALAGDIFEEKSRNFRHQSRENLDQVLQPFKEQLNQFRKKVEETHAVNLRERAGLSQQIKNLQELNKQMSQEAVNLTKALKGQTKTQGTWGEMILETVLEKSGLEKGREYEIQVHSRSEEGKRYQPDVIVHLPQKRDVIIDSKVSLIAYEKFCNAESEKERLEALQSHLISLRGHIRDLSRKAYQDLEGLKTMDFVFLFIPVEGALSAALQGDSQLFMEALDKNIVLVGPATLLATLRTIENLWRQERQNQNVMQVVHRAGKLYDKFASFVSDMQQIGSRLNQAQQAYDGALNKLSTGRGNILRQVEELQELGIRGSKKIPENLFSSPQE